jgi:hypothetical protein
MIDLTKNTREDSMRVFKWVVIISCFVLASLLIGYAHALIDQRERQIRADREELSKWRDAREECTYAHAIMDVERLEAACYRESFHDGDSLETAMKQCHGIIDQCDTTTAVKP